MKVGEITRVKWYRFENDPHYYSFHVAQAPDRDDIMLRSNESTWPSLVAEANNITYSFMRNATDAEVELWLEWQDDLTLADVKEI